MSITDTSTSPRPRTGTSEEAADRRISILFVEDEPGISSVFAMLLELEGYAVTTASDGIDGLERLRSQKHDLLITDHMMPRMNGMDLTRSIRADPDFDGMPILLISAAPPQVSQPEAMPDAFLQKPMGGERLLEAIAKLLAKAVPAT